MRRLELSSGWTVRAIGGDSSPRLPGTYPAEVPGSVHTDLIAAGVIRDPYLDAVEEELRWMYDIDWRYATVLNADPAEPGEQVDLVFDGIDTIGTVRLRDGEHEAELGRTYNMHRSYRFDVTPRLSGRPLDLEVDLGSATAYAESEMARLGDRVRALPQAPYNFIRKMACSFGWDWGPDLRTAGLWKPVRLERWRVARLDRVRPLVTIDAAGTGRVELRIDLERMESPRSVVLAAEVLGHRAETTVDGSSAVIVIDVPDAPLWWPAGYGDQPLAELTVTLTAAGEAAGEEFDRWQRRIGFRTVELDTADDAFTLSVNGRPLFAKGVNWIPDDHFLTRITPERIQRRLDQAVAANLNLVRVWGGGIYESEEFYRACDERGLLVWQDFLLACAAYPEEAPLWDEIEAEARENIVRLMTHPSLAIYNGGNENLWGHEDWQWKERLDGRTWGARYAYEMFPSIIAELDPTRPYCENSPCSPGYGPEDIHPNDPDHGSHHQWEVWNQIDYTNYRSEIPRFVSEFGFQAPPTWRTLTDWIHPAGGEPLSKTDPTFLLHQKAADGNGKLDRGLAPHLGIPDDFADWHWATQLNQARAVTYAIDHYRRWWPRTAGAVVWQINDCWPVTSWAAIDSEERPKPLWYALRNAFAPQRLVFGTTTDEGVVVAVLNDTDQPWHGDLTLSRQRLDGSPLATATIEVEAAPRTSQPITVPHEIGASGDAATEIVVARLGRAQSVHTFVPDLEMALEPSPLDVEVTAVEGGYAVTVTARSFARDVSLLADRVAADATVDDALITLAAGQDATFQIRTVVRGLEKILSGAPVLRTANDLRQG
jgi:beta-mannosidase